MSMRVLLISQEVPPETAWGGIGTYIGVLAPALRARGADVEILSVVPGQARSSTVRPDGVVVHRAPLERLRGVGRATGLVETWGRLSLARAVAREVDRLGLRPDVVESPNWMAEGLVLSRRRQFPVVVRLHSWASQILGHFNPRALDARLAIHTERRLVRQADMVIGTSVQIDAAGPELGLDPEGVRVIPPPLALAAPAPPAQEPTVLFVGRLEARKGPETVVAAFPQVVEAIPDARLVLAGRDSTAPGISSYAAWLTQRARELGVGDHVTVLAERPDDDAVAALRAGARVCVMPSRWESFGYVAAEALGAGRAVVASDVGGLREVVEPGVTGHLVPAEDHRAWSAALVDVLADPDRAAAMGEEGVRRMRERYAPDRIADLTLEAYEAAARRFAGRPSLAGVGS